MYRLKLRKEMKLLLLWATIIKAYFIMYVRAANVFPMTNVQSWQRDVLSAELKQMFYFHLRMLKHFKTRRPCVCTNLFFECLRTNSWHFKDSLKMFVPVKVCIYTWNSWVVGSTRKLYEQIYVGPLECVVCFLETQWTLDIEITM